MTAAAAAVTTTSALAASLAIGLLAAGPIFPRVGGFHIAAAAPAAPIIKNVVHFEAQTADGSEANAVVRAPSGGYFVVGWGKQAGHADRDLWLIKTTGNAAGENEGQLEWSRYFGGTSDETGLGIIVTRERAGGEPTGLVLAGSTIDAASGDVNAFVVQTDLVGTPIATWNEVRPDATVNPGPSSYGDRTHQEIAVALKQLFTADGSPAGFIVAGNSIEPNSGNTNVLLFKLDTQGNLETTETGCFNSPNPKTFGVGQSVVSTAHAIAITTDAAAAPNGLLVAGETNIGPGNKDVFLLRTSLCGVLDGAPRTFGGANDEVANALIATVDGNGVPTGYLIAGRTGTGSNGVSDALLIKTDLAGNQDTNFPGRFGAEGADFAKDIKPTLAAGGVVDGYILAGGTNSQSLAPEGVTVQQTEYWLSRLDLNGTELWHLLGSDDRYNALNSVLQNDEGAFVGVGQTQGWNTAGKSTAVLLVTGVEEGHEPEEVLFHRGDVTVDGNLNLTDAIALLNFLFSGGVTPRCMDAADADDTGRLDLADPINILNYLFLGSDNAIKPPGPPPQEKGVDPKPDELPECDYPADIP